VVYVDQQPIRDHRIVHQPGQIALIRRPALITGKP
jgi:hypothetical protein